MQAVDSLGLEVTDANVTTLNGLVLNNLKVQVGLLRITFIGRMKIGLYFC